MAVTRPSKNPPYPSGSWAYLDAVDDNKPNGTKHEQKAKVILNIAIIGAGVGGLAAAIGLRSSGHDVTVYEKAHAVSEIGAGIQVPPNSARILHSWGLETALSKKSVQPRSLYWKRWQDGEVIAHTRYRPYFAEWFNAPYYVIHRAHLHEVLYDKARELGVVVVLDKTVKQYDFDKPSIGFEDGDTVLADLIIAADGLRSGARREMLGAAERGQRNHGMAAYRATVPVSDMKNDPLIASNMHFDSVNLWIGHKAHVMSYGVAGGNMWNIVATVPEDRDPSEWDSESSISVEKMKSFYEGWDPTFDITLPVVTSKWPIQDIYCLQRMSTDSKRLILLGDAAHAMIPFMSIGAAMAVEDACAITESLKMMRNKGDLDRAVEIFEKVRVPRVTAMHQASYRQAYTVGLPDGPEQRARDLAMRPEVEGRHFIRSPNQWSDPTTQIWAYSHDPAEAIRDAWVASELAE